MAELKADPALPEKIGMSVDRVKRFWFTNEDRIPVADLGKVRMRICVLQNATSRNTEFNSNQMAHRPDGRLGDWTAETATAVT